jgi:CDP-diacylglycerol--serine O-phosphatidyltransferase
MLTVANIFLGYFAIVLAFRGQFLSAATLILVATLFDKLDGLVARATGTASEFGRELDSLADVVSFGVAPSLLAFAWGLEPLGKAGWAAASLFLGCGALRLARFNVQTATVDRRFFVGLPIPMASALPVTIVVAACWNGPTRLADRFWAWWFLLLVVTAAFLMVSRIRYFAFKEIPVEPRRRRLVLVLIVTFMAAIAAWPEWTLPAFALLYAAHGPLLRAVPRLASWLAPPRRSAHDGTSPESMDAAAAMAVDLEDEEDA